MIFNQGLHRFSSFDVNRGSCELADDGWKVFVLPNGLKNTQAFFQGIRSVLPLDPPVLGNDNWDALSDSLWGGLDSLDTKKIAIIWPSSVEMEDTQPEDFEIATSILSGLTESLADVDATLGNVKQILVILA